MFKLPPINIFGTDPDRDKETLFLTLALELGRPKPYADLATGGGGKGMISNDDGAFVMRFAELANKCGVPCDNRKLFREIYNEYEHWYSQHHA